MAGRRGEGAGETHHVQDNVLTIGLLYETTESSREGDRVEYTRIGDDTDYREK